MSLVRVPVSLGGVPVSLGRVPVGCVVYSTKTQIRGVACTLCECFLAHRTGCMYAQCHVNYGMGVGAFILILAFEVC